MSTLAYFAQVFNDEIEKGL